MKIKKIIQRRIFSGQTADNADINGWKNLTEGRNGTRRNLFFDGGSQASATADAEAGIPPVIHRSPSFPSVKSLLLLRAFARRFFPRKAAELISSIASCLFPISFFGKTPALASIRVNSWFEFYPFISALSAVQSLRNRKTIAAEFFLATAASSFAMSGTKTEMPERPNILLIVTDDSGYTDLGCYGGEIDTPNIDALGRAGMRFRNFYTNGRCSPTRASIMTGRDCSAVGFAAGTLGGWDRELQRPAYRGRLSGEFPTIAEVMKSSGYHTMMAGKWHLGGSLMKDNPALQEQWKAAHPGWELTPAEIDAEYNTLPLQRGFNKFFGMIEGETHFFFTPEDPQDYVEGNWPATIPYDKIYSMFCYIEKQNPRRYKSTFTPNHGRTAKAFYDTDGLTDRALEMIRGATAEKNAPPFFMYLAYRAPHKPLQAPQEIVEKYLKRYDNLAGVEKRRAEGLVRENLLPTDAHYHEFATAAGFATNGIVALKTPEKIEDYKLTLAVHAAMLDVVDQNIGRIVDELKARGEFDNTLIIYLSDNGAASHVADILNKPYYGCKSLLWEGGLKTHLIAHWPEQIKAGSITDSIGWVGDFLPTFLDIAGGTYPKIFNGKEIPAPDGRSLFPVFKGIEISPPEIQFFNDKGQQVIIQNGRWKLIVEPNNYNISSKIPGIQYELYDLQNDPAEFVNLEQQLPEKVQELALLGITWQKKHNIVDYGIIKKELGE